MAQTYVKTLLSESSDGQLINISATAVSGTTLHVGPSLTSVMHKVWIYAANNYSASEELKILWGVTTTANGILAVSVPSRDGLFTIANGRIVNGNATPNIIKAIATSQADIFKVWGEVDVITTV